MKINKFLTIELPDDDRPETLLAIGEIVEFAAKKLRAIGGKVRIGWRRGNAFTCRHGKVIGHCPYGCWQPVAMNRAIRRQAPGNKRVPKKSNRARIKKENPNAA